MFDNESSYCLFRSRSDSSASTVQIIENQTSERSYGLSRYTMRAIYCSKNFKPFLGFFYTALHCISLLLSYVLVKKLTYISPGQLSLVRNGSLFAFNLPIAVYCVKDVLGPRHRLRMLMFRSFLGATALYLNFMAFRYLPLAESSIIMSATPALVSVMARLHLKESFGVVQFCAVILTTVGVLLSIRLPDFLQNHAFDHGPDYFLGLACAVAGTVMISVMMVTVRKMTDIHFSVILIHFGMLGVVENALLNALFAEFTLPSCEGWDSWKVVLTGVFGVLASCFLTLALQAEEAGIFSVVKASMDIVVAMVFQVLFFGDMPDMHNVAGGLVVLLSVALLGTKKWLLTLPEGSQKRRRLRYLLL